MNFLMSVLFIIFLYPAVIKANTDEIVAEESCDEIFDQHLRDLLEKDHNGILSLHYQLTMLKLAKKTLAGDHKSLEEFIKKDVVRLNNLNNQDPQTLEKLNNLYSRHADEHLR